MTLLSDGDPEKKSRQKAKLIEDLCLGCGVCKGGCSAEAISLAAKKERIITPVNSAVRIVLMAIERGKLQNLIFDNQLLFSHRAMAAVLGAILRMPPVKRAMASEQMQSRYLERIIDWFLKK